MRLIITFLKRYPAQTIITLLAMLFAGLAEGFGLSMLLPLLGLVINSPGGAGAAASKSQSSLEQFVARFFDAIGMTPTILSKMDGIDYKYLLAVYSLFLGS